MKKSFVLDTSVLLHDPLAIFAFEDNDLIIPLAVIEEIDGHKKRQDEVGRNARHVSRQIDLLRGRGKLYEGVALENGGTLRVELNHQGMEALPAALDRTKMDNRILAVALAVQKERPEQPVILVTKDINMRVKSDAVGVLAEDFETDQIKLEELYGGVTTLRLAPELIDRFYQENSLPLDALPGAAPGQPPLFPNQFVALEDEGGTSKGALARVNMERKALAPLRYLHSELWGVKPRNREQKFAMELLMDDDIRLVTLVGKAGTGKTLLALAAGLQKVTEEHAYRKLLVSRPVVPMGNDIGFLPGDKDEKLRPWMQPIYDNLELLFANRDKKDKLENIVQSLKDLNLIELEALTYIRGRSIPNQYFILDEAQNLSPHEVKTIITRVGEGTKLVITGDPYQIDHPYLDSNSNGLTYVVEKFKNEKIAGHVTLTKGERSELAEMAARLL
ncbi:MAG: PhoH family protein [Firmicutes bacterium]|nr:PhoH family protein [Bacillota bacterium]